MLCAIGFGIYFDRPARYTPSPRQRIAIPVHAGIIHAPNIKDNGMTMNTSSIGENSERPININIVPITICFNHITPATANDSKPYHTSAIAIIHTENSLDFS